MFCNGASVPNTEGSSIPGANIPFVQRLYQSKVKLNLLLNKPKSTPKSKVETFSHVKELLMSLGAPKVVTFSSLTTQLALNDGIPGI